MLVPFSSFNEKLSVETVLMKTSKKFYKERTFTRVEIEDDKFDNWWEPSAYSQAVSYASRLILILFYDCKREDDLMNDMMIWLNLYHNANMKSGTVFDIRE